MSLFCGENVAITGRLCTMTRAEAIQHLEKIGALFASFPNRTTKYLVVGQADGPLGKNGKPSAKLRKARTMQNAGGKIKIISEAEFLNNVGRGHLVKYLDQLYTASQLKRIVGVRAAEIRVWTRQKLIHPAKVSHKLHWFDFKEVMLARSLHELTSSGVKLATITKSLNEMSKWLPGARAMLNQAESFTPKNLRIRLANGKTASPDGELAHMPALPALDRRYPRWRLLLQTNYRPSVHDQFM